MAGHFVARGITKRYAGLSALVDVDLEVRPGEMVGLIGPNGAGKTTFFNCVTGFTPPSKGLVELDGIDVTGMSASARARLGMARTFQQAQLFGHLSVRENLLLGRHRHYGASALACALRTPAVRRAERAAVAAVEEMAARTGLTPVLDAPVADLPYGTHRLVEVARALASEPAILLLDEPGAGMDTTETAYFGELLRSAQAETGCSVLLIEHDVALVMATCERMYVLDFGQLIAAGTPEEVRHDPRVREAYLGEPSRV
jgi:branched-chain amino acid transport system ATP-binding protein